MKSGIELIAQEREEQLTKHNRSVASDSAYNTKGQLVEAAIKMLMTVVGKTPPKGWNPNIWKRMRTKSEIERYIIAGAFLAAEIDRLQFNEGLEKALKESK